MIDEPAPPDRHGLEAAVRMLRKSRHDVAVIHPPAVFALEILPEVTPRQRGVWSELGVTLRVAVEVVHAEEERIGTNPGEAERQCFEDEIAHSRVRVTTALLRRNRAHGAARVQRPA